MTLGVGVLLVLFFFWTALRGTSSYITAPFLTFSIFHQPKYSGVIVYLVGKGPHTDNLVKSLHTVQKNVPAVQPWPIILFHAGEHNETSQRTVATHLRRTLVDSGVSETTTNTFLGRIEWVGLNWTLPADVPKEIDWNDVPVDWTRWPGMFKYLT